MLLYRISGTDTWVDWDVLHNDQGYSKFPCVSMTYKKISPWGTDGGSGYKDSQTTPFYFVSGNHGWLLAVSMPGEIGLYPSEATPLQMINGAVVSNAVTMDFLNDTWYLIEAEIANERYWLTESMVEELGWEVYEEGTYEFVFVDSTTGRVVHGVERLSEIVFEEPSPYPIVSRYVKTYDSPQTLADGAYIDTVVPYYPTKLYIASCADNTTDTQTWFGLSVSNEGGYVRVTNTSGAGVTLSRLTIQSMDATDASVVEVKDDGDNHAWAFKWDDNGTPYWYIEYHAERTWLASLGRWTEVPPFPIVYSYSGTQTAASVAADTSFDTGLEYSSSELYIGETNDGQGNVTRYGWETVEGTPAPVLPTVSVTTEWVSQDKSATSLNNTYRNAVYDNEGAHFPYSSQLAYAPIKWFVSEQDTSGNSALDTELSNFPSYPDYLYITNNTGYTITIQRIQFAVCSDSTATVVTVYDSSNVAYNAFKYTTDGTDYYYVLDGTQADWTDDLSSIGYRLDMQFYFYFKMSLSDPVNVTFDYPSNDNYWTLRVRNQAEKNSLSALGLHVDVSPQYAPFGYLKYDTSIYSYELKEILLPDGSGATFNLLDFYIAAHPNAAELWCNSSYSTAVRSCLISIKPL